MTLIQPKIQNPLSLFNTLLGGFLLLFLVGVVWLIMLYTGTVNLRHGVMTFRSNIETMQVQNATIKDQMFALLSGDSLASVAAANNLIRDTNPRYLQLKPIWEVASRY